MEGLESLCTRGRKRFEWNKIGMNGQIIAFVSARWLPPASVGIRGLFGRKMEDGELLGKKRGCHKWQKLGGGGPIIASVFFRGRPLDAVDIRGHPLFVRAEDG